jgi:hypothetical protein
MGGGRGGAHSRIPWGADEPAAGRGTDVDNIMINNEIYEVGKGRSGYTHIYIYFSFFLIPTIRYVWYCGTVCTEKAS